MPQPFFYILNSNATYEKDFLDGIIYNNNMFKGENKTKDNLKIFEDEIKIKKSFVKVLAEEKIYNIIMDYDAIMSKPE